jgi:hypothetical protein
MKTFSIFRRESRLNGNDHDSQIRVYRSHAARAISEERWEVAEILVTSDITAVKMNKPRSTVTVKSSIFAARILRIRTHKGHALRSVDCSLSGANLQSFPAHSQIVSIIFQVSILSWLAIRFRNS